MLVGLCSSTAHAGDPLKPYVVLALDTSGSMNIATGSGPPSCGGPDTRINHARCAINRIVNSYGDIVFGLGRFRMAMGGTFPSCTLTGAGTSGSSTCNTTTNMFELLSAVVDGDNEKAAVWTDGTINTCTQVGSDPEIWGAAGNTPLEGTLSGAKAYWQGLQGQNFTIWPTNLPGYNPIVNDPLAQSFLPKPGKPASCNPNPTTCDASAGCTSATNCCCLEQCRPYITILLTDGDETCGGNPPTAADSLLRTDIGTGSSTRRYRIETKAIGFGIPPGDADVEAIAQAGGEPNGVGNEGFYASDEAGLQLAISAILADAIRTESCNNLDDDCDVLIDEDFPGKGSACNNDKLGICRVNGAQECRADGTGLRCNAGAVAPCTNSGSNGLACSVTNTAGATVVGTCQAGICNPTTQTEVCNTLDDDCDGKIDEGLNNCVCSPQGEQCDNDDDDCDGRIDEGIVRPCGTGTCQGTETCAAGVFGGCTAQTPTTEICNGLDDNCDGVRDGFNQGCSTMPPLPPENFAIDDPRNNPGHPTNNPIPENICQPGVKNCPANVGPPNNFGACQGEIKPCNGATPCVDTCDGLDNDCDNDIDENFTPADCSTNCGVGTTSCINGVVQCNTSAAQNDPTCNNVDDDCDNIFDEDWVSPGTCGAGPPPTVCNGLIKCINGAEVCVGDTIAQESCNCDDDDCDTKVDEGSTCPTGATCSNCQCAFPCAEGEFPCPMGKFCKDQFCIADPCFGVTCPNVNGDKQVCRPNANGNAAVCVTACSIAQCNQGEVCIGATGECKPDNCVTFPDRCTAQQNCIAGVCVTNLCQGVNCPTGEYCIGGQCYGSCAGVECDTGQRCRMGICEADPCGGPCPFGKVCIEADGMCKTDPCTLIPCQTGEYCNPQTVMCEPDPCVGTACPDPSEVCKAGTCVDPQSLLPDAAPEIRVTTGGGGGCNTSSGQGLGLLFGLALLAGARRRRVTRRATGGRS
ncbi:MAG: hypothetical protein H0T89_26625 [Deltaproteobacteria bacterium]|nr:hypothetical protein [Deltaproteobacteria bacterium]MDQ3297001.1 MopE-related protein [Myxococcota bacterium]